MICHVLLRFQTPPRSSFLPYSILLYKYDSLQFPISMNTYRIIQLRLPLFRSPQSKRHVTAAGKMDNMPVYLFKLQISLLLPLYYTPRFKAVPIHKCKFAMDIEDNVIKVKNRSRGKWAAGIQANSPAAPIGEVPEAEVAFPGEDGIPDVQDHPVLVISSGGSMLLGDTVKTATASRSREIFLGLGNTGLSLPQLLRSSRLFEADPSPGLWPPLFGLKE